MNGKACSFIHCIDGKLEIISGGFKENLRREKNEEIDTKARVSTIPVTTHNDYPQKKEGNHMILPYYAAIYNGDEIAISEEYFDFA